MGFGVMIFQNCELRGPGQLEPSALRWAEMNCFHAILQGGWKSYFESTSLNTQGLNKESGLVLGWTCRLHRPCPHGVAHMQVSKLRARPQEDCGLIFVRDEFNCPSWAIAQGQTGHLVQVCQGWRDFPERLASREITISAIKRKVTWAMKMPRTSKVNKNHTWS